MKILLDSVILIDHFNGIERASKFLQQTRDEAAISVITRAEVLAGFETRSARLAARLLDSYPNLPLEAATADLAADLRRTQGWKLPDAFQAAVARQHGLKLATRNSRDFPPERYSFVLIPYRV